MININSGASVSKKVRLVLDLYFEPTACVLCSVQACKAVGSLWLAVGGRWACVEVLN